MYPPHPFAALGPYYLYNLIDIMFKPTFFLLIHKMYGGSSSEISVHQKAAQDAKLPMFIFSGAVYSTKTADYLFHMDDLISK